MIFLIDYDRKLGRVFDLQKFSESERTKAIDARLQLELQYHRQGVNREVVLLEAPDEAAIRKTHRRYFATLEELAQLPDGNGDRPK